MRDSSDSSLVSEIHYKNVACNNHDTYNGVVRGIDQVAPTRNKFRTIPCVNDLCNNIRCLLRLCQLNTIYTVSNKLDVIIKRGKDVLVNGRKTGIVYKINCLDCDACYIGQTKRHLDTRIKEHKEHKERIKEHKSDVKKHESNHSVVSKHRILNNYEFDWSNVHILVKEDHLKQGEIAEMFFIKRNSSSINLQRDTENLPVVYDIVLKNT
ncbi:hypothetical protein X777_16385 [Ooceraea biroi]|uniref:GIY-YIG domain-containing protein n=1 Tax=Ooceraea biroi TaxID=2015173 RepID=A0A026VWV0_OOCBI|nr:hypothetical protein X777_16385 [Ooceraea biroi]